MIGIVQEDIKVIESTPSRDLAIWLRLFELYSEKHGLLVQGENELKIEAFTDKSKKNELKTVEKMRRKTLSQLLKLSAKLIRKVRDPEIKAKIYYFEALSFYLSKNEKMFYKKLKLAEKYAKSIKYKRQIYSRLADYHFNKRELKGARKYYTRLIKLPKDKWYPKYLYNLAWVYYKFNKVKTAVKLINRSYAWSKKKGYVDYRNQSVDTVMLFYANSNRVTLGMRFLEDRDENTFDNLLKFMHYVFEHGTKKNTLIVIKELNSLKLDINQQVILLTKELLIYRSLKRYPDLQKKLVSFDELEISYPTVKKEELATLVNDLKGYTGLLQSLVKNFPSKRQGVYSGYISSNFDLLAKMDPMKSVEYEFFTGETYFSVNNYKKAIEFYNNAIDIHLKTKYKDEATVVKTFDSYFKSLEYLKRDKQYAVLLEASFKKYLSVFPNKRSARDIYKRLIAFYFSKNALEVIPNYIAQYNKNYPRDVKVQQAYFKQIINSYAEDKDIPRLEKVKALMTSSKLSFNPVEFKKLDSIIFQLYYGVAIKELASKEQSAKGMASLLGIFNNEKYDRRIRTDAIVNIMKYHYDKKEMGKLAKSIESFQKYANAAEVLTHIDKIKFYTSKFCEAVVLVECISGLNYVKKAAPRKFDVPMEERLFRFLLLQKNYQEAFSLIRKNKVRKEYFKQYLMAGDFNSMINFLKTAQGQGLANELKNELTEIGWLLVMNDQFDISSGALSSYDKIDLVDNKIDEIEKMFSSLKKAIPVMKVVPPIPEKEDGEITFEMFSKFLEDFIKEFQFVSSEYNKQIKNVDHHFALYIIKSFHNIFFERISIFKNYDPVTSDPELKKAILGEMQKLVQVMEQKNKEFIQVQNKSSITGGNFSGSNYYNYIDINHPPLKVDTNSNLLWKE